MGPSHPASRLTNLDKIALSFCIENQRGRECAALFHCPTQKRLKGDSLSIICVADLILQYTVRYEHRSPILRIKGSHDDFLIQIPPNPDSVSDSGNL